jgi:hypothetical protein
MKMLAVDAMFGRDWNPTTCPTCPARAAWPPSGIITQTHTIGGANSASVVTSWILLVVAANETYTLPASQLYPPAPPTVATTRFLAHRYGAQCVKGTDAVASGCLSAWQPSHGPMPLQTGGPTPDGFYPWQLLTLHACSAGSWCVIGELCKYVTLSANRWTKLDGASFCAKGSAKGESVTVWAVEPSGQLRNEVVALDNWSDLELAWTACGQFTV